MAAKQKVNIGNSLELAADPQQDKLSNPTDPNRASKLDETVVSGALGAQVENDVLLGADGNSWSSLTPSRVIKNFYSALALCLVSFPFVLIMVLSFNQTSSIEILTYSGSIMTNIVGFATVLAYSNGRLLFRTFTGFLYPIIEKSIEDYGKEGLATVSLYVTVFMFVGAWCNAFQIVKFIPSFLFDAFKIGAGILLIFSDVYSLLGIKSKSSEINLYDFSIDVVNNWDILKYKELLVSIAIGVSSFLLQRKFSRFPWPSVTFICGIIYGYWAYIQDPEGLHRASLLRDVAPQDFDQEAPSMFRLDFSLLKSSISGIRHPEIAVYGFGVLVLIFFEVCIAISVDEDRFHSHIPKSPEFLSLAVSNALCLVLGILPQSVPIGRQKFVMTTGADHKVMHLFSIVIMLMLYFFCFKLTGYMPICAMKGLNILISINLLDFKCILCYGRYSKIYPPIMITVMVAMLFTNLAWCILISVLIYVAVYCIMVGRGSVDMTENGNDHLMTKLSGKYAFRMMPQIISKVQSGQYKSVSIEFGDIAWHEINYLRHYMEAVAKIASLVPNLSLVGIKRPGSNIAQRLPVICKYIT